MVTIREIFDVTWTITRVEVTARDEDLKFLCYFWIGDGCNREGIPKGMLSDYINDSFYFSDRAVNAHGEPTRSGPETGWGLKKKAIPDAILDAPIWVMGMNYFRKGGITLRAEITISPMQVEILKKEFEEETKGE